MKVFERCIYNQIAQFYDKILSKHQHGFRKGHSHHYSLIILFEKWKEGVDQGHVFRALLTDLSKGFDCLLQNILVGNLKIRSWGLLIVHCMMKNKSQMLNNNGPSIKPWGTPEKCDMWLWYCKLCKWQYSIFKREKYWGSFGWFRECVAKPVSIVYWKRIERKCKQICHLLISSGENVHANIGTSQIKNSDCERLLGTDIDCKLSFEIHFNQICSKARRKLRIALFLNKRKRKPLMNAFSKSQFSYCPLSLMFQSSTLNNMINRLHERSLRIHAMTTHLISLIFWK